MWHKEPLVEKTLLNMLLKNHSEINSQVKTFLYGKARGDACIHGPTKINKAYTTYTEQKGKRYTYILAQNNTYFDYLEIK